MALGSEIHAASPAYAALLVDIKQQVEAAQVRAALSVSHALTLLYRDIGRRMVAAQTQHGWGARVVDRLAVDLRAAFPGVTGFSRSNLMYMRAFALAYPDDAIVQHLLDNCPLPWGHHVRLLDKEDPDARHWYVRAAFTHGWSRAMLEHHIDAQLFERHGKALTNFDHTLPSPQSDLARQALKDPYNFDFLTLSAAAQERHLEAGLLAHLREFLVEMGTGFAFVGSQYPLTVSHKDYLRPALLSPASTLFHSGRFKDVGVRAGVRRQNELLPRGG